MRTIWCGLFNPISLAATGRIPKGYRIVEDGTDKAPGLIGHGFGGEAVICLIDGDKGQWFRALCAAKDPEGEWPITQTPKEE